MLNNNGWKQEEPVSVIFIAIGACIRPNAGSCEKPIDAPLTRLTLNMLVQAVECPTKSHAELSSIAP
jgi:hypothetical protein